jgi:serine O-acetyltransferase
MRYQEFLALVRADFYRYDGSVGIRANLERYFLEPGARFTFWYRLSAWLKHAGWLKPAFVFAWLMRRHYEIKYGISIPTKTVIGAGLYISHFGGIVVNGDAVLGRNCNLGNGVTIGMSVRGSRMGCPTIGDDVFIGPGARIIGKLTVGHRAAIGANSVVLSDVPDDSVMAGLPAKIVSTRGSAGYINWRIEDKGRAADAAPGN